MPAPSAVIKSSWEKCKGFVIKAGTVIFAMSIVIWLCQNFTLSFQFTSDSAESIFGNLGAFLAPIFAPLGFGNWQSVVALLSGLVAKEAVVSTFGVLYSAGGGALSGAVASAFTPLSALSFMTFSLLYIPCISAMVTIKKEMGGLKWAVLVGAVQMCTAYVVSLLVYQIGNIFF
jgi:ferrous iron transport protein B